ncbi:MAG: EamA family transporter [Alphaproteobacteria bacterium]|nr:EamA family transporter [Alphaproteobacteria bacterium]
MPQHLRAVLWMLGTLISLSLMGLSARELSAVYDTAQILFVRNMVGFMVILLIMLRQGVGIVRTQRVGMHALRNFVHIIGVGSWFYGIALLPLAEVFVLESTLPIWVVLLAIPFLGERFTLARGAAVALGFAGILIILRPGLEIIDPAALIVLVGAFGFASANVATKALTRTEGPLTILFWMFLLQLAASAVFAVPTIFVPPAAMWPWVAAVGLTGIAAHYCTARSLTLADAGLVIPLHYLRVPLIAWLGWLLYDETVDIWLGIGALVIFIGTMITVRAGKK